MKNEVGGIQLGIVVVDDDDKEDDNIGDLGHPPDIKMV
jgi:hypothetical protein